MNASNNINDSSLSMSKNELNDKASQSSNTKLYIIIGVISGAIVIAIIVILTILMIKKDKPKKKSIFDNAEQR